MSEAPRLVTDRLILRGWEDGDREPFAALNADPAVMENFPATLSRDESDAMIDKANRLWAEIGLCWFAVQRKDGPFIGFTGLHRQVFRARFTPAVEIGWRLARAAWGQGFASEAARAAIDWGFEERGLDEIVSFTVPANRRSVAVMERLGMTRDPSEDFQHPALPPGHALRQHVLYRLGREDWMRSRVD